MILFKIIFLQILWFLVIIYGKSFAVFWILLMGMGFVLADYYVFKPKISLGRYLFLIGVFTSVGYLNDSSLIWFDLIHEKSYHYGNLALWIIFVVYYEHIFIKFKHFPTFLLLILGSVAGALTYWSAAQLGAVAITDGKENLYISSQGAFWAIFFPISLKLYFEEAYWNKFLDKTVIFSFDASGFRRHQKMFAEDLTKKNMTGKNILVTGGTAGIGREVAAFLSQLGASVFITGRNKQKAESFIKHNHNAHFISLDMANWKELYHFAQKCEKLDHIVFNAGSMPEKLSVNEEGVEFQCASQLMGHYYLMVWLKEFDKIKPGARIVWVSSGGMYLKKLELAKLFNNLEYEKVETYANVKRAQVTLVEELAKQGEWRDTLICSMHPGWVETDGLKEALPRFYRLMKNRLRNPKEGADTILWCLLTDNPLESGGFYFDRKKVSPYISRKFYPSPKERSELLSMLEDQL